MKSSSKSSKKRSATVQVSAEQCPSQKKACQQQVQHILPVLPQEQSQTRSGQAMLSQFTATNAAQTTTAALLSAAVAPAQRLVDSTQIQQLSAMQMDFLETEYEIVLASGSVNLDTLAVQDVASYVYDTYYSKPFTLSTPSPNAATDKIPRWFHGITHVCRTAILVRALYPTYCEITKKSLDPKRLKRLEFAALFHDCMEKSDIKKSGAVDELSHAREYYKYATQNAEAGKEALYIAEVIANKNYRQGGTYYIASVDCNALTFTKETNSTKEKPLEAILLHDADTIEVCRFIRNIKSLPYDIQNISNSTLPPKITAIIENNLKFIELCGDLIIKNNLSDKRLMQMKLLSTRQKFESGDCYLHIFKLLNENSLIYIEYTAVANIVVAQNKELIKNLSVRVDDSELKNLQQLLQQMLGKFDVKKRGKLVEKETKIKTDSEYPRVTLTQVTDEKAAEELSDPDSSDSEKPAVLYRVINPLAIDSDIQAKNPANTTDIRSHLMNKAAADAFVSFSRSKRYAACYAGKHDHFFIAVDLQQSSIKQDNLVDFSEFKLLEQQDRIDVYTRNKFVSLYRKFAKISKCLQEIREKPGYKTFEKNFREKITYELSQNKIRQNDEGASLNKLLDKIFGLANSESSSFNEPFIKFWEKCVGADTKAQLDFVKFQEIFNNIICSVDVTGFLGSKNGTLVSRSKTIKTFIYGRFVNHFNSRGCSQQEVLLHLPNQAQPLSKKFITDVYVSFDMKNMHYREFQVLKFMIQLKKPNGNTETIPDKAKFEQSWDQLVVNKIFLDLQDLACIERTYYTRDKQANRPSQIITFKRDNFLKWIGQDKNKIFLSRTTGMTPENIQKIIDKAKSKTVVSQAAQSPSAEHISSSSSSSSSPFSPILRFSSPILGTPQIGSLTEMRGLNLLVTAAATFDPMEVINSEKCDRGAAPQPYDLAAAPQLDSEVVVQDALELAADQGDAEAQYNLGLRYEDADAVQAARFYQLAAIQGHTRAQFNLGRMYADGRGVAKDDTAAARLYGLVVAQREEDDETQRAIMLSEQQQYYYGASFSSSQVLGQQSMPPANYSFVAIKSEPR